MWRSTAASAVETTRVSELVKAAEGKFWFSIKIVVLFFFPKVRVVKDSNRFAREFVELETSKT